MRYLYYNVRSIRLFIFLVIFAAASSLFVGCSEEISNTGEPANLSATQEGAVLSKDNPAIKAVMSVQDRHTAELMKNPNVVGTATGLTEEGKPAILVLTKSEIGNNSLAKGFKIPEVIEGVPVRIFVTGELKAFKSTAVSHTAKQTPPIQLGTSGGWRYDLANGYCCGGTLGSLITDGTKQYILSNWHVLYSDIVSGGNNRVASSGDPVIQPGLIDVGCNAANAQDVARLLSPNVGGSLPSANVDAGIAEVIPGMVSTNGAILEVGTLSASTVGAFIGQAVKKSGRTTGLTRSSVEGLNATVNIAYDNECAGGAAFTKTFTGQVVIKNRGSKFLNSGDSGSLMVEDITTNPRAVGLLYAGSSVSAIANPINDVLSFYGSNFRMVGL